MRGSSLKLCYKLIYHCIIFNFISFSEYCQAEFSSWKSCRLFKMRCLSTCEMKNLHISFISLLFGSSESNMKLRQMCFNFVSTCTSSELHKKWTELNVDLLWIKLSAVNVGIYYWTSEYTALYSKNIQQSSGFINFSVGINLLLSVEFTLEAQCSRADRSFSGCKLFDSSNSARPGHVHILYKQQDACMTVVL